jgi:lipoprotein-anchoring transpeptidase ErfK/SrfK
MSRRRKWLAVIAAVALTGIALVTYAFYVQAGTGDAPRAGLFAWRLPWAGEPRMTATPTKTPAAPPLATATATPLQPLPTLTATMAPTAAPQVSEAPARPPAAAHPSSTPAHVLSDEVVRIAREWGVDPAGRFVIVDQNRQQMHIAAAGLEVRTLPVSTGNPDQNFSTPGWSGVIGDYWGSFNAAGAWADNAWYLFTLPGGGAILIHSAPYTLDNGIRTYQGLDALGLYPASRGCIRLLPQDAEWFTAWQPQGAPIVILPWDAGSARQG